MKASVVIIEDDQDIAQLIALYLGKDGIDTRICPDGELGLREISRELPDLVVLDINLPGMDGYEVLQTIKRSADIPVVMVTARQEDEDAILGFGMGADDYVSKPFSPKVLAARIRTHLSRARKMTAPPAAGAADTYQFGPYLLDSRSFVLLKGDEKMSMSPREIDMLVFLARAGGQPKSQEELFHEVWGRQYGDMSTVAVHVQRIRKKIEENPAQPKWLKTTHGRGYFLEMDTP